VARTFERQQACPAFWHPRRSPHIGTQHEEVKMVGVLEDLASQVRPQLGKRPGKVGNRLALTLVSAGVDLVEQHCPCLAVCCAY
jgi:hypothetical protein